MSPLVRWMVAIVLALVLLVAIREANMRPGERAPIPAMQRIRAHALLGIAILLVLAVAGPVLAGQDPAGVHAPAACVPLTGPGQIASPTVVTFDDLPTGSSIGSTYQGTHGVRFEDSRTARVIAYDHPSPRSAPMTAMSQTDGDPAATALTFYFDSPQASVGLFAGNGGGASAARLEGFDADGNLLCAANATNVSDAHTAFVGFRDDTRSIVSVSLTYTTGQAESLDDLSFSSVVQPPATPTPSATPSPSPTRPAAATAALFIFPAAAAPGGAPAVSGYGFPALADLKLILACPGQAELDLGVAGTDAGGRLRTVIELPAYPPNPCMLAARQDRTNLAEVALTLLPALELTFAPQAGPPGTVVSFTVRNLVAGELRLDYAGRTVAGPLNVAAGSYSGTFVVPADRPDPLGELAELRATNLILGRAIGEVTGAFRSQAAPPPPTYRVADLQLPPGTLPPGSDFAITGRISPAPQGPLADFQVVPVWRKADGRTFPIGREAARISADGDFSARVRVPSLLTGDPTWPQNGDQAGVMLVTGANQPQPFLQAITGVPIFPTFNVIVVDAATNQLIPSAKVSFEVWKDHQVSAGSLGALAGQAMTGAANQVGQVLGTTELTDDEKARIALIKFICMPQPIPVNSNYWELINPTLDQTLSEPPVQGLAQGNSIIVEAAAAAQGAAMAGGAAEITAGEVIPYLLTVDALDAGYGLKKTDGQEVTVKNLSLRVNFHLADLTYRDLKGNVLANPYTVKMAQLASGDQSALGPIGVFVAGLGAPELSNPTAVPLFSRYYSVKNVPPGVQVKKMGDGKVRVSLSYAQYHNKLGAGGMKLYLDGVWAADIPLTFNPGLNCSQFKGVKQTSAPFYEGQAVIPNAHLLAPGSRALQVRAQLQGGQWVNYDYVLQVDDVPQSWFEVKAAGMRTLNWSPGHVYLFTPWLKPDTHTQWLHSDPAQTNETGQLDNRTIPTSNMSQQAEANGHKGGQTTGQLTGQALNRYGQGCNLSNCPSNIAAAAVETLHATSLQSPAAGPAANYSYGPYKENVVPEVTFDLPEVKYGIPFVAEVAGGGSVSYSASVTYQGAVTLMDDGAVQSVLTVDPEADVSGTVYVEGRLLAGLIGKAGASLTANFDMHMPITYDTAKGEPAISTPYFKYGADFKAWHKWGCVPYVGCAYSKEYPQPLFHDCKKIDGSSCPAGASAVSADSATAADPPQFDLQLAASGQGTVMAIWQQTRSSLATSLFNGAAWSPVGIIATGAGSSQPQIAFLTPNRAIAVWTETNLTEAQLPGLTGEELLQAQRIAYAIWNGTSWSAGQPLTTPGLGEGGPALTACPAGQPGCPAGGAAVAVWERNLSANLAARDIRLYHARYQDGAWSAPQPVDGASAFTDILPQVAYINGVPLVAWVRDGDADLTDANSRRIALRFLDGGAVFMPAELPAAIAEVALAVDGTGQPVLAFTRLEDPSQLLTNRRPLWAAAVTCSGPATCTWQPVQLTDPAGRTLYAEQPVLATTLAGQVIVTFRGTGFGGDAGALPGDPAGMVGGQGELVQATLNTVTGQVAPKYLTQDAAVNWLPAATYDPLLGVSLATAVKGSTVAGATGAALADGARYSPAPDLPIAAAVAPDLPDFALVAATVSGGPATGDPLRAIVQVANTGAAWPGSAEQPLEIVAAWDSAPGIGVPAGQAGLTSLGAAPFVTVTLDLAPPPDGLDEAHVLHLAINPGLPIVETDAANNSRTLAAGGLTAPPLPWAQVKPGSRLVFLGWEVVPDRRVAGYRVYRARVGGAWQPIGGSFAPGYVDLSATAGTAYTYAIATYTADGVESRRSQEINVTVPPLRVYLPLVVRGTGGR